MYSCTLKDFKCRQRSRQDYRLLILLQTTLTCDARADSGSTLAFASKVFLFDESIWVLQSMDLMERTETFSYNTMHQIIHKTIKINLNSSPSPTLSPPNGELWKNNVFEFGRFSHLITSSTVSCVSVELLVLGK